MFVHSVYFWLKPGLSDADRLAFFDGVRAMREIETVAKFFVGTPAATDRPVIDRSYDCALVVVFHDKAGHDAYQVHPLHDAFRQNCERYWSRVVIYDAVDEG